MLTFSLEYVMTMSFLQVGHTSGCQQWSSCINKCFKYHCHILNCRQGSISPKKGSPYYFCLNTACCKQKGSRKPSWRINHRRHFWCRSVGWYSIWVSNSPDMLFERAGHFHTFIMSLHAPLSRVSVLARLQSAMEILGRNTSSAIFFSFLNSKVFLFTHAVLAFLYLPVYCLE